MRYRVRHHGEEFGCPACGEPVYVGETAWEDDGGVFCSAYCAGADPGRQAATKTDPFFRPVFGDRHGEATV